MYVLGIETSCDETAVSIVKNGNEVLSNTVASSIKFHAKYGGIIPEIASRMQLDTIYQVAESALVTAGVKLGDIGLLAVTTGPGLLGSLVVGLSFAKATQLATGKPLLGLNHIHSHIYGSFLSKHKIRMPCVALVASGGHTSLFHVRDFASIKELGSTLDDAAGEAFDKVAKILGLDYPGGPQIEKLARKGNPDKIKFNCSDTKNALDFSFSGIKTAVLYYSKKHACVKRKGNLPQALIPDIAASFQEAVVKTLVQKTILACKVNRVSTIVVGGGVAANNRLRETLQAEGKKKGIEVFFPEKQYCLDNAAMVAGLAYRLFKSKQDIYTI